VIPDLCSPVEEVAPRLLGAVIRHEPVAVRLTELEAYDGTTDPASHAFRGPTPRNAVILHLRHALGRKHQLRARRSWLRSADAGW
jgi:3-methyladenine DNA glycosylase Mpg